MATKSSRKSKAASSRKRSAAAGDAAAETAPPAEKPSAGAPGSGPAEAPPTKRKPRASGKTTGGGSARMLPRAFLVELAEAIRDAVLPLVRSGRGREVVGSAASGDSTFHLDAVAEKALLTFLRNAKLPVAYYSEDAGYTTFTNAQPEHLLIVDPVDGSRAAKCGFESCCVSVASTRVIERPRLCDVDNACVMEIVHPRTFYAERGKGARILSEGKARKPKPSTNTDLELMSWSMSVPARPAELVFGTAGKLIDISSLKGGFFACNSTAYSLTRLVANQLDATVDIANRYLRDIYDAVEDQFVNAGRGAVLGMAPYDVAGALLVAQEAGCIVTDAYGRDLGEVLLLDSSPANQQSLIAAANAELHGKLMEFFDLRVKQFEHLLNRRSQLHKD